MRDFRLRIVTTLLCLSGATGAYAQQTQSNAAVPRLVRFNGSFRPVIGQPTPSGETVTLAVYRDQTGGTPLWQEVQNVTVDADGRYSLLMGATLNEGMPLDLFPSGEARWLGVQFNRSGEVEQPRVLLASVPYALKASDAETLGGRPASAYLLADPSAAISGAVSAASPSALSTTSTNVVKTLLKSRATPNTANFVAKFLDSNNNLTNSTMYDINGFVGFGTTNPNHRLHVFNSSPIIDSNLNGQLYVQNTYPSNSQGHASLVLDKGSSSASAALSFNSVGAEIWDVGATDDNNFHIRSLGGLNPKPVTLEHGASANSLYINAGGNVGLGTTTPGSKLDVAGDMNFTGSVRFQGSPVLQIQGGAGNFNISLGVGALQNSTGGGNMAFGASTLANNTTGSSNTAEGSFALQNNTTGGNNVAIGVAALNNNVTGNSNIAIGANAASNVASSNFNNIHIGSRGATADNNTIRIGNPVLQTSFFVAGVRGINTGNNDAIPVVIDSNGQLGTVSSSRRFKEDIEDMGNASMDLMRLRPVTYRYKEAFNDGSKPIQYGLIAEEVAEVYPDLVAHSSDGQIETVKYQVLDSMLLNEVQRQQAEIGAQKDQVRRLEQKIDEQSQQNQSLQERLAKLEAALASTSREAKIH